MAIILTAYPSSLEVTQGEHVLEGGIRNYDVEFRFPENDTTWRDMALVGVFKTDLGEWAAFLDLETKSCKIPWEALDEGSAGSSLAIGLYGVMEDDHSVIVRSTVWAAMPFRILPGPDAEPAQDPSPSIFQQILSSVSQVVQRMTLIQTIEKTVFNIANQVTKLRQETEEDAQAAATSADEAEASARASADSATASAASAQASADAQAKAESAAETATEAANSASESKVITLSAAREAVQAAAEAKAAQAAAEAAQAESESLVTEAEETLAQAKENTAQTENLLVQAASLKEDAEQYATEAKSWAVGETDTREGENTDNSKYYASQAALTLEEMMEIVSEYKLCGGTVHVLDVTIPAEGWVASDLEEYPYTIDVVVEESDADYFPDFALDHDSLDIAGDAGLCSTIEALDGIVRFWSKEIPAEDMAGVLALSRAGEGNTVDVATDEEVENTIEEVFGEEVEVPDSSGSGTTSADIATDEEVQDVIDDVFGTDVPTTDSSGNTSGYEVATEEEVAETIEDIFGDE